jgi:hypothetical protein
MKLNVDIELIEIVCLVQDHFKDHGKTWLWLGTDNMVFGGISPLKLIAMGRGKKVLQYIKDAKSVD